MSSEFRVLLESACARLDDMLLADDGQAWKEAAKFLVIARANLAAQAGEVERLERLATAISKDCNQCANERNAAQARAERLEAALRPFAALYQPDAINSMSRRLPDSQDIYGVNGANITLGHLREAVAALTGDEA